MINKQDFSSFIDSKENWNVTFLLIDEPNLSEKYKCISKTVMSKSRFKPKPTMFMLASVIKKPFILEYTTFASETIIISLRTDSRD